MARRVLVGRRPAEQVVTTFSPDDPDVEGSRHLGLKPHSLTVIAPTSPVPFGPMPVGHPDLDGAQLGQPEPAALAIPLLPGPATRSRQVRFVIVNALTVSSLLLGMAAIFLAMHGELRFAAFCVIGCVTMDGLDGAMARKLGVASPFGGQMDSLADMCAFGIATPVLAYRWLDEGVNVYALAPACALVTVCAAIRLARFNVSPKDSRYFCGVPTTIVAAILALATLVHPEPAAALVATVAVLGALMVSTFPYLKLAQVRRLPPWLLMVPIAGLLVSPPVTFGLAVATYLVSGPVLWMRQRRLA